MSKDVQCPYCSAWQDVSSDNREPEEHYEHTCIFCENIFGYTIDYIPCYTAYVCPCANGEPHNFIPIQGHPREYFKDKFECSYCGERK